MEATEAAFALASASHPTTWWDGLGTIWADVLVPQFEQSRFYRLCHRKCSCYRPSGLFPPTFIPHALQHRACRTPDARHQRRSRNNLDSMSGRVNVNCTEAGADPDLNRGW